MPSTGHARDCCVQPEAGIEAHNRPVAPESEAAIGRFDAVRGPAARCTLRSEVCGPDVRDARNRGAVIRLLRGDDAECAEARNVGGIDRLDVLDAMPPAADWHRIDARCLFIRVQRRPDGAVADGVDEDLPPVPVEIRHQRVQRLRRIARHPAGRRVRIGLEHRGGVGFDHAVHEDLHGAGLEDWIVAVPCAHGVERFVIGDSERRCHRQRRVHAHVEIACLAQFPVEFDFRGRSGRVLHAGDANALRFEHRRSQRRDLLVVRGRWDELFDQALRAFLEHAGRFTGAEVLDDHAVGRILSYGA